MTKYLRSYWDVPFMAGAVLRVWISTPVDDPKDIFPACKRAREQGDSDIPLLMAHLRYMFDGSEAPTPVYMGNSVKEPFAVSDVEKNIAMIHPSGLGALLLRLREPCHGPYTLADAKEVA